VHRPAAFYKYMSARRAVTALVTRELRWSSPILFNDPFDVTQELRLNFDEAGLTAALNERMAGYLEQGDASMIRQPALAATYSVLVQFPLEQRRLMARALREVTGPTPGQVSVLADLREKWRELVPTFRILCLSELRDVTPMWSHYADQYRGVVLEFSPVYEDSPFLVARPVVYQDDPPAIADPYVWADRMIGQLGYADLFMQYQYIKRTAWSYEKEWRIVVPGARPGETGMSAEYGFNRRDLTGIYFGSRCSETDRSDLLALLAHGLEHVRAYEAVANVLQGEFMFRAVER